MLKYKILDLCDEKGALCGKILADLGAEVIKIEPPAGDPSRAIGPFYHDEPGPENSLTWWAFNTGKKDITLDLETPQGKEIFKQLAKEADAVLESFAPGYLDSLGLGYEELHKLNKGIVLTSVTPFGQDGPYAHYKGDDLVLWAVGGVMYQCGYPDRAPMRPSTPQVYPNACLQACAGTLAALFGRNRTGEGDHVDVSGMETVGHLMMYEPLAWKYEHRYLNRCGAKSWRGTTLLRQVWSCKDGMVAIRLVGGKQSRTLKAFVDWMIELGDAGDLDKYDWNNLDLYSMPPEEIDHIEGIWAEFLLKHTKAELFAEALKRRFDLTPVQNCADLVADEQLRERDYWQRVEHEDLGESFLYPGAPFKSSQNVWSIKGRSPHIGEHNEEILGQLSYTKADIDKLKEEGII